MATRLFFHDASSTVTGTLPTDEQSADTPSVVMVGAGTCRTMDSITGVSMAVPLTITGSATLDYKMFLRTFATSTLDVTQVIPPQVYVLNLALANNSTSMNFGPGLRAHLYVWDPATGTKRASIFDNPVFNGFPDPGNVTGIVGEGSYTSTITVTALAGDILVAEIWSNYTAANISSFKAVIAYDGTTVNTTDGASIVSHASFMDLNTSTLTFGTPAGTIVGTFNNTLATVALTADGAVTGPFPVWGSLVATFGTVSLTAVGDVTTPTPRSGSLAATFGTIALSADGSVIEAATGSLVATFGSVSLSAVGNVTGPFPVWGSLVATFGLASLDASGTVGVAPEPVPVTIPINSGGSGARSSYQRRKKFVIPDLDNEPVKTLDDMLGIPRKEAEHVVEELPPTPVQALPIGTAVAASPPILQYTPTLPKPSPVVVEEEEYSDDDLIRLLMLVD